MKSELTSAIIIKHAALLALLATLSAQLSTCLAQGTAITYQGQLNESSMPATGIYDLQFTIYNSTNNPGTVIAGPLTKAATAVSSGLFTVTLDFGAGVFDGSARWLEIGVRTNGSADAYTTLSPRQPLTPSPYAIFSGAAASISNGVIQNPAFIGTTGDSPLRLYVNGQAALRLDPTLNDASRSNIVNAINGSPANFVAPGVNGATISGGGAGNYFGLGSNSVTADFGTVGGGLQNASSGVDSTVGGGRQNTSSGWATTVGGGRLNANSGQWATIAGGSGNLASGSSSAIGGGDSNTNSGNGATIAGGSRNLGSGVAAAIGGGNFNVASGFDSTIGGGAENTSSNLYTTVGGGWRNLAGGQYGTVGGGGQNTNTSNFATIGGGNQNTVSGIGGTVPGGTLNRAAGGNAFAAGNRAKADHAGAFVWADNTSADFASTSVNQFLIRAAGGVGIGITNPASALHVAGTVTANSFTGSGAGISNVNAVALGGLNSSNFWKLDGNAGTTAGTHFLGTTDNQPLEFKVNGGRALRFEPNTNGAPNVIGGSSNNFVPNGVVGATIAGGGAAIYSFAKYTNSVTGNFGTVSGGAQNTASSNYSTVGGGHLNSASGLYATVSGGTLNTVSDNYSTIGGGYNNTVSDRYATVSGGSDNTASGFDATVGGGVGNTASGDSATVSGGYGNSASGLDATVSGGRGNSATNTYATVGGGYGNTASGNSATVSGGYGNTASGINATVGGGTLNTANGDYSFAAGLRAKANHDGAFVWADSQSADFTSSSSDQFLIRAQGGVGIGNNNPQAPLHVTGGGDAGLTSGGNIISGSASGQNIVIDPNEIISRNNGAASDLILNFGSGNVGIRRVPATNELEVAGNASKTTAGGWLANSDARIKTRVQTVTKALDKLSRVRLVQFHYSDGYRATHPGIEDREYLNVVAQEFQEVFPDHVKRSGEKLANGDDILQVDTYPLTIYSAAAVQELNAKLTEELKRRDAENAELKARLTILEKALTKLAEKGN